MQEGTFHTHPAHLMVPTLCLLSPSTLQSFFFFFFFRGGPIPLPCGISPVAVGPASFLQAFDPPRRMMTDTSTHLLFPPRLLIGVAGA